MTLQEYHDAAMRTSPHVNGQAEELQLSGLGLTGEAGEVADIIKKHVYHGHELDPEKIKLELGDILWYIARCAQAINSTIEEVAEANIAKLNARYPNGFSSHASINRTV